VFKRSSKIALLQKVPLFKALSQKQLREIARLAEEIDVIAGKRLVTAGDVGYELFVIVEGNAIARTRGGRTVHLGPGDFFGEMSLIDRGLRSATVEAASDMRLFVVGGRDFWQLLEAAPPLVAKILVALSQRVREAETSVSVYRPVQWRPRVSSSGGG
jgi:CRP-like cAMP-binding protein